MELIAHRGAPNGRFPENSLGAFRNALALGLKTLEFDLRLTRDDRFVVLHDAMPKRLCEASKEECSTPVCWQTFEHLRSLRLKGMSETLPTLDDMLHLLELDPEAVLFAEVKDKGPHAARCLLQVLQSHPLRHRVVVLSFEHRLLQMVRESSDLRVCPLYRRRSPTIDDLDCEWEAPLAELLLLDPTAVAQAHRAGRKVAAWFLVAQRWHWLRSRLQGLGVDAIMVDTFATE